jgi:malonate transporter
LILSHAGLFLVSWLALGRVKSLRGTPSIIYALMLSTSATPVFGIAVLEPLLGPTSAGTVGLVALAINLTVPPAVVLLEMDAAAKHKQVATEPSKPSAVLTGISAGLKSPLLWAPILGIAVVLASIHLPAVVASCFELIGSATSGVAVFAVGLVLASHPVRLSPRSFRGFACSGHNAIRGPVRLTASVARGKSLRARGAGLLQFSVGYRGGSLCSAVQGSRI